MAKEMKQAGLWTTTRKAKPVALLGVEATAVVYGGHAAVVLRQRYRNEQAAPIEAIYTFPLPWGAGLTRFAMEVGGRRLEGEVKGREEAFADYDGALIEGHGAALLEQERDEIATVTVGNLLPGEEVTIEVEYVEPVQVDEGALRFRLPTRVAPRYVGGSPAGDRTGHGTAEPTARVPDADRITPPEGQVGYGLRLTLLFDLGHEVEVESPSHRLQVEAGAGGVTRVSFSQGEVALDRDVIVVAQASAQGPATTLAAHREGDEAGYFSLSLVPDLAQLMPSEGPLRAVFLIDISGSMEGQSLEQAVAAARLCLRQLRAGDEFALLAFNDTVHRMEGPAIQRYDGGSLERADRWLGRLRASNGTEMQKPLVEALGKAGAGLVILLTDGQVADEAAIYEAAMRASGGARVYSFGIGAGVCEGLLRDLARGTRGAVELIYPGESIDEKVVAQFARATAPRIDDVELLIDGVEVNELSPAKPPPIIDGEPWSVLGRYKAPGKARALLAGRSGATPFTLELSLDFPARAERPALARVWARDRIRELEKMPAEGRHRAAMEKRITDLALSHGLASRYTSFVVVDRRTGARLSPGVPQAHVVPVQPTPARVTPTVNAPVDLSGMVFRKSPAPVAADASHGGPSGQRRKRTIDVASGGRGGAQLGGSRGPVRGFSQGAPADEGGEKEEEATIVYASLDKGGTATMDFMEMERERGITLPSVSSTVTLLTRQGATGLWGEDKKEPEARVASTAAALWALQREGIFSDHDLYGAQVRKAIEALVVATASLPWAHRELGALALAVAWLSARGRRTRAAVQQAMQAQGGAAAVDEAALRELAEREAKSRGW